MEEETYRIKRMACVILKQIWRYSVTDLDLEERYKRFMQEQFELIREYINEDDIHNVSQEYYTEKLNRRRPNSFSSEEIIEMERAELFMLEKYKACLR